MTGPGKSLRDGIWGAEFSGPGQAAYGGVSPRTVVWRAYMQDWDGSCAPAKVYRREAHAHKRMCAHL